MNCKWLCSVCFNLNTECNNDICSVCGSEINQNIEKNNKETNVYEEKTAENNEKSR